MPTQSEIDKWLSSHNTFYCNKCRATITRSQCRRNIQAAIKGRESLIASIGKVRYGAMESTKRRHNEQMLFICAHCTNGKAKQLQGEAKKALKYLSKHFYKGYGNRAMELAGYVEDEGLSVGRDSSEIRASNHAANKELRTL